MDVTRTPTATHDVFFKNARGMVVTMITPSGPSLSWHPERTCYFRPIDAEYLAMGSCSHLTAIKVSDQVAEK